MSMERAKELAAELGLDEKPNTMDVAYRMTDHYVREQIGCDVDGEGALLAKQYGVGCEPEPEERDLEIITGEIIFYKRQAGTSIIEIGKRLIEAKAQLGHGDWLPWLREKVDISERSATNFMRLAREYSKSAEIADFGASKALALLALPESERADFTAEKHDVDGVEKAVADMTAAELKRVIAQRDAAEMAAEEERKRAECAEQSRAKMETDMRNLKEQMKNAREETEQMVSRETAKLEELQTEVKKANERALKFREAEVKSREKAKKAQEELQALKNRPVEVAVQEPSAETLAELSKQAEAAAEQTVTEAHDRLAEAQARADAAEEAAAKAKKELELAGKEITVFQLLFNDWQKTYNDMMDAMQQISEGEKKQKLRDAVRTIAERMQAV